ncbi:hypothetical protein ALSL_1219 [Aerosticca soli]|uniref:Uncharacterized protein n=1 Tax=Aerosticca soli TaxID=2010829 RepID=A0A2Z6E5T4_9GAMM|nr:hypothetical protein ALSL_1219 [Aerosticca soli]
MRTPVDPCNGSASKHPAELWGCHGAARSAGRPHCAGRNRRIHIPSTTGHAPAGWPARAQTDGQTASPSRRTGLAGACHPKTRSPGPGSETCRPGAKAGARHGRETQDRALHAGRRRHRPRRGARLPACPWRTRPGWDACSAC